MEYFFGRDMVNLASVELRFFFLEAVLRVSVALTIMSGSLRKDTDLIGAVGLQHSADVDRI